MQPEVLLMDEPFAALDALTRRKMQEELGRLWEELRFTLLFVTHSIEEALVVGNRILLLSPHPGQVRAELNSHQFDLVSAGSAEFQAAAQRIHRLLFGDRRTAPDAVRRRRRMAGVLHREPCPRSADPAGTRIHGHAARAAACRPALPLARSVAAGLAAQGLILVLLAALWEPARWQATTCCCRPSCKPRRLRRRHRQRRAARPRAARSPSCCKAM
jgi:hypothetical protein